MRDGDPDTLRRGIDRLAEILPVHFAYEERPNGFLSRIARRNGDEAADLLRTQHGELLEAIADIAWRDLALTDGRERAMAFAKALAEHEEYEGRLALHWVSSQG